MARRSATAKQSEQLSLQFDVPHECCEISLEAIRVLSSTERLQCQLATRALGFELASVRDADAWWHDIDRSLWIRVNARGFNA